VEQKSERAPTEARARGVVRPGWHPLESIPVFLVWQVLTVPAALAMHAGPAGRLSGRVLAELALGVTVVAWVLVLHRSSIAAIGFPARVAVEIALGAGWGLVLWIVATLGIARGLGTLLHHVTGHYVSPPRQLPVHLHGGAFALAAVLVVVAAVSEELFFRGFLYRSLRARAGFVSSAVISAAAFGAAHYYAPQSPWQDAALLASVMFFVGLGLAFIYDRRGNVVASISSHAAFNLIALSLLWAGFR
jgi:membrane protease YdiL (CAAX protease family)